MTSDDRGPLRRFLRADLALVEAADKAVAWAWDKTGLPYQAILKASAASYVVGCGLYSVDKDFRWWALLIVGAALFDTSLCIQRHARFSVENNNLLALMRRHNLFWRGFRWFQFAFLTVDLLERDVYGAIWWATFITYCVMSDVIQPTRPRRRKPKAVRSTSLALLPAPIEAR